MGMYRNGAVGEKVKLVREECEPRPDSFEEPLLMAMDLIDRVGGEFR